MPLLFPVWWETPRSTVGSRRRLSAGNPQIKMKVAIPKRRRSCQNMTNGIKRPAVPSSGFRFFWNGLDRGNEFTVFEPNVKGCNYCRGQTSGQWKSLVSCSQKEATQRNKKISLLLHNQSPAWHLSEAVCADLKLNREKQKSAMLVYETQQTSLMEVHQVMTGLCFLSPCCSQWCRVS